MRNRRTLRHNGIAMFRNLEEALAFVFQHGLHRDLISPCRYGYIIRNDLI